MIKKLKLLFCEPSNFYKLEENRAEMWPFVLVGYFLMTFSSELFTLILDKEITPPFELFQKALIITPVESLKFIISIGIFWIWIGSRIAGGKSKLKDTIATVGFSLFYPGLFSLMIVPMHLLYSQMDTKKNVVFYIILVVGALLISYTLVNIFNAIRQINNFSKKRMLIVIAWAPIQYFLFVSVITGITMIAIILGAK